MRRKTLAISTVAALGIGGAVAWLGHSAPQVEAADHTDPPSRTTGASADTAADIGDVYAFVRGENTVLVVTFAGPLEPTEDQTGTYDADVLYTIWVDEDGAATGSAATPIHVRFGQNSSENWGVQVTGFPGATGALAGPVEFANEVPDDGGHYWAGLREDPFFFDLMGFQQTLATGEVSFDNTHDFFAGKNITAIVLEIPNAELDATFDVWATTARVGS